MSFCPNCGQVISDGSRFCGACGHVLQLVYQQPAYFTSQDPTSYAAQDPYAIARDARGRRDILTALNWYNELSVSYPNDWEALFYSRLYQLMMLQTPEEQKLQIIRDTTIRVLDLIADTIQNPIDLDTITLEVLSQSRTFIREIHQKIIADEKSNLMDHGKIVLLEWQIGEALIGIGDKTEAVFGYNKRILDAAVHNWKFAIVLKQDRIKDLPERDQEAQRIEYYITKVKYYDPSFLAPKTWFGIGNIFAKTT